MGSIPIRFRQIADRDMAKPTRPKKFSAPKQARKRSREVLGTPPATRVIPDRREKAPKHRKRLIEQTTD
jgi:hypothetical protein